MNFTLVPSLTLSTDLPSDVLQLTVFSNSVARCFVTEICYTSISEMLNSIEGLLSSVLEGHKAPREFDVEFGGFTWRVRDALVKDKFHCRAYMMDDGWMTGLFMDFGWADRPDLIDEEIQGALKKCKTLREGVKVSSQNAITQLCALEMPKMRKSFTDEIGDLVTQSENLRYKIEKDNKDIWHFEMFSASTTIPEISLTMSSFLLTFSESFLRFAFDTGRYEKFTGCKLKIHLNEQAERNSDSLAFLIKDFIETSTTLKPVHPFDKLIVQTQMAASMSPQQVMG